MPEEIDPLRQQIFKLEKNIVELNNELKNTKETVKRYNNLRDDITKLAERMRAIEVIEEATTAAEDKHYRRAKKNTSIRQDWIMILVTLAMVGITVVNVLI